MNAITIDFSTVAVLLLVLWLDGWRRVAPGDVVVRRAGLGAWELRTPSAVVGSYALVAWWPPVVLPFVVAAVPPVAQTDAASLPWKDDHALCVARGRRRLGRVAADVVLLRVFGASLLLWIAFGIPLMTARSGGAGLLRGIGSAFVLSAIVAIICFLMLRMSGVAGRTAARKSFTLLSPFTAPRAAEIIVAEALDGLSSAAQLAALLSTERFTAWVRPWAYDEMSARPAHDAVESRVRGMISSLPSPLLSEVVASAPLDGSDERSTAYCPRCGHWYYRRVAECSECPDVPLRLATRR